MKKTLFLILVLSIIFSSLSIPAFAAGKQCVIEEMGLVATFPSEYSVITRSTPANDPVFDKLGTTKAVISQLFESENIYLNAICDSPNEEIAFFMTDNDIDYLNAYPDYIVSGLAATLGSQLAESDLNLYRYETHNLSKFKFIKLFFTNTDKTIYGIQYFTIYGYKAMNFVIYSYAGEVTDEQEEKLHTIVKSLNFADYYEKPKPSEKNPSFVYTDSKTGATFTIPDAWEKDDIPFDEFIDLSFFSQKNDTFSMLFSSLDVWEMMSAEDKIGLEEKDVKNSLFSFLDIAKLFDTNVDNVDTVTYNDVRYFKYEDTQTAEIGTVNITTSVTCLLFIENGRGYLFQFIGNNENTLYSDFESVINSVKYPSVPDTSSEETSSETAVSEEEKVVSQETQSLPKQNPQQNKKTSIYITLIVIAAAVIISLAVTAIVLIISPKKK